MDGDPPDRPIVDICASSSEAEDYVIVTVSCFSPYLRGADAFALQDRRGSRFLMRFAREGMNAPAVQASCARRAPSTKAISTMILAAVFYSRHPLLVDTAQ